MSLKLPNLDHLSQAERAAKMKQIEAFLLEIVYSKILPGLPLERQIEVLRNLERLGAAPFPSAPTTIDDDPSMLSDVLSEAEALLL